MAMRWHLRELIGRAESVTQERITYKALSEATGLSTNTITQIAKGRQKRVDLSTLDRLLDFFSEKLGERLDTNALLRHIEG